MKKVIIIGSGPAGISAALYLQRSGKTEVCVIAKGIGALDKADKIENYYGFAEPISGKALHENGITGAKRLGVFFIEEEVVSLAYNDALQPVVYTDRNSYTADAVLLATGSSRQTVPVCRKHSMFLILHVKNTNKKSDFLLKYLLIYLNPLCIIRSRYEFTA